MMFVPCSPVAVPWPADEPNPPVSHRRPWRGQYRNLRPPAADPHAMLAVEAGEGAGIHLVSFDLDALRAYRRAETLGNAFRRPAADRPRTDAHIAGIFVRVNRLRRPPGV